MGVFRFKQFSVDDTRSGMKVGTDAVLLGAWCEVGEARRILDIGTGSGVIALMMAQRSASNSTVDALDVQRGECEQAEENVRNSPWPEKIFIVQTRVQDYQSAVPYDLILCNPPYFINSLLPPDQGRETARHNTTLTHEELIRSVCSLLGPAGAFDVILPLAEGDLFAKESVQMGLFIRKITRFHTLKGKPQERSLMRFRTMPGPCMEDKLFLYRSAHAYTHAYVNLTRDFYL